ncbi:MAG: hypothetical protein JWQ19_3322 [Subtercola sp.]|nr:hypothetical protein [Subtercola sp.]
MLWSYSGAPEHLVARLQRGGVTDDEPAAKSTPQQKAEAALQGIADDANPTRKAFSLAHDFTDSQTERLRRALKRLTRRH